MIAHSRKLLALAAALATVSPCYATVASGLFRPLAIQGAARSSMPIELHSVQEIGQEIWVASSSGLYRLDGGELVPKWQGGVVLQTFPFRNALYFATEREGIRSLRGNASTTFTPRLDGEPLTFKRISAAEVWHGALWIAADQKLYRVLDDQAELYPLDDARVLALEKAGKSLAVVTEKRLHVWQAPREGPVKTAKCDFSSFSEPLFFAGIQDLGTAHYVLTQRVGTTYDRGGPIWVLKNGDCEVLRLEGTADYEGYSVGHWGGEPVLGTDRGLLKGDPPAHFGGVRDENPNVVQEYPQGLLVGTDQGLWRLSAGVPEWLGPSTGAMQVSQIWQVPGRILLSSARSSSTSWLWEYIEAGRIEIDTGPFALLGAHWLIGPQLTGVRLHYACEPEVLCLGLSHRDLRVIAQDADSQMPDPAPSKAGVVPIGPGYGTRTLTLRTFDAHGNSVELIGHQVIVLPKRDVRRWLYRGLLALALIALLSVPTTRILTARFVLTLFLGDKAAQWLPTFSRQARRFFLRPYAKTTVHQTEPAAHAPRLPAQCLTQLPRLLSGDGHWRSKRAGLEIGFQNDTLTAIAWAEELERYLAKSFARPFGARLCPILLGPPRGKGVAAPDATPPDLETLARVALRTRGDIADQGLQAALIQGRGMCFLVPLSQPPDQPLYYALRQFEAEINARSHVVYVGSREALAPFELPTFRVLRYGQDSPPG